MQGSHIIQWLYLRWGVRNVTVILENQWNNCSEIKYPDGTILTTPTCNQLSTYFISVLIARVGCDSTVIRLMCETCKYIKIRFIISTWSDLWITIAHFLSMTWRECWSWHLHVTAWRHSSMVGRSSEDLLSILAIILALLLHLSSNWRMKLPVLTFCDSPTGSLE